MLNLINDQWIPVVRADGSKQTIAPWQISDLSIVRPNWPRADLNIACYEFLIGLVYMADPPLDEDEWEERAVPDGDRLKSKLGTYAGAFNLIGDGPLFLQDTNHLNDETNPVDMLFIDSAGKLTAEKNADLFNRRNRYDSISLPLAAMALYTLQAFAPAGGGGMRTSMRGGGPLVTLLDPDRALFDLVWANMPNSKPAAMRDLPWMRPARTTEGKTYPPPRSMFNVEAFFGMPRRLRLIANGNEITGVKQKVRGLDYALWKHPLTPYRRMKPGEELLPIHPKPGHFGYRQWLGVVARSDRRDLHERALVVENNRAGARIIVAGWSMDNSKACDFILSHQPRYNLTDEQEVQLHGLIRAAVAAASSLRASLSVILSEGNVRDHERDRFFMETEADLLRLVRKLPIEAEGNMGWLKTLRTQALKQFDALTVNSLNRLSTSAIRQVIDARDRLEGSFRGYGTYGTGIFKSLNLTLPAKKKVQPHDQQSQAQVGG